MREIIRLGAEARSSIMNMEQEIWNGLDDESIFEPSPEALVARCLGEGGMCHGIMDGSRLVAYCMVYFPFDSPENLGRDLGLPAQAWPHVAHLETIAVAPAWRGRGLARALNERALEGLRETSFRHLCSTVSPANPSSLRVMLGMGLFACDLREKYGGKLRFILHAFLPEASRAMPALDTAPAVDVPLGDIASLREKLAAGYVGVGDCLERRPVCLRSRNRGRDDQGSR